MVSEEMTAVVKIAMAIAALVTIWNAGGWHVRQTPTAAQLFGCEHTYINERGEDTGECG